MHTGFRRCPFWERPYFETPKAPSSKRFSDGVLGQVLEHGGHLSSCLSRRALKGGKQIWLSHEGTLLQNHLKKAPAMLAHLSGAKGMEQRKKAAGRCGGLLGARECAMLFHNGMPRRPCWFCIGVTEIQGLNQGLGRRTELWAPSGP